MAFDPSEALKGSWQWTEGVTEAGIVYGPDTYTTDKGVAPASGVKVRKGNPTDKQIAIALSTIGYESTDQIFTVWRDTLREDPEDSDSQQIYLTQGDKITHEGLTWVVKSIKTTQYGTQCILYCRLSSSVKNYPAAS